MSFRLDTEYCLAQMNFWAGEKVTETPVHDGWCSAIFLLFHTPESNNLVISKTLKCLGAYCGAIQPFDSGVLDHEHI